MLLVTGFVAVISVVEENTICFSNTSHNPAPLLSTHTLLPGSRLQEVKRKLPLMIEASKSFPHYQVVVACSINLDEAFYREYTDDTIQLVFGDTYNILNQSTIALVTSGTATLETALFHVPQVVCYKSSPLSFAIAKLLVKIKYIS